MPCGAQGQYYLSMAERRLGCVRYRSAQQSCLFLIALELGQIGLREDAKTEQQVAP